jgi:hypothetical protein
MPDFSTSKTGRQRSHTYTQEFFKPYRNNLIPFHSKIATLWKMNVIGNNKTYLGVHVMWPTFLSNFKQTWIFSIDFYEVPNTKFHGNPSWDPR